MNGLPYYKAYPRDFIEGTIGMPFELKGAYRLVLDLIYMQGGHLPDDARYISGQLGCSIRKWNALRAELVTRGKIIVSGEFLTNYRAEKELETLAKLQETKRENRAGASKNNGLEKRPSNHTEPKPEPKSSSYEEQAREAFALFSAMAERIGCAVPAKFSDARKRSLLARLSECGGLDGWTVALGKVEASSFLRGSAWFGLDWMLKPSNFTKIMEGNYDDRDCASARGSNTGRSGPHDALMAGFARLANSDDGTGGDDFGGGETSYCAGPKEMDGWTGGDSSQPLLRLVGER